MKNINLSVLETFAIVYILMMDRISFLKTVIFSLPFKSIEQWMWMCII